MAKKTPHLDREREFAEEAARLALLDVETQRDFVAMFRIVACDPKASKEERARARALSRSLRRLLGLSGRGRQPPSV